MKTKPITAAGSNLRIGSVVQLNSGDNAMTVCAMDDKRWLFAIGTIPYCLSVGFMCEPTKGSNNVFRVCQVQ